jgi:RNA polymerase sigma-70 factor (ECF subfamily)
MAVARRPTPLRIVGEPATATAEPRTLDEAFRRYSPYVASIAYRLLGRDEDVDDAVQEVFLIASRGIGALREAGALRGWLATVTVRVSMKKLRMRRLRTFLHLDDPASYVEIAAEGATPEERAIASRLYAAMDTIPAVERVAWTLRHVEGEKLEDVARLCGCSLATAKRRIAAAHAVLHAEVDDA